MGNPLETTQDSKDSTSSTINIPPTASVSAAAAAAHKQVSNFETKRRLPMLTRAAIELDPTATRSGYATDVIAVLAKDGKTMHCTDLNVRFRRRAGKRKEKRSIAGLPVAFFVDGKDVPMLELRLTSEKLCSFAGVRHSPGANSGDILGEELRNAFPEGLSPGAHSLRFQLLSRDDTAPSHPRFVEATLWVYNWSDSIVISDIDGTITRTDLRGMLTTAFRSKVGGSHRGYAHRGICKLYNKIVDTCGCRVIYLTARPIRLMNETREYVNALQQGGQTLPAGAVVSDTTKYFGAVRREIIEKTSHVFKMKFLNRISLCFQLSGRDVKKDPLYLACFGNKPTDARAYLECGAHEATTFMINKHSTISAVSGRHNDLDSYSDPVLREWLEHLWKYHRPTLRQQQKKEKNNEQQRTMSL